MRFLFIIPFLFISFFIHGQTQVLKKYNFEEGGYYLLGILAESDYNKLSDSLKEWYTDDIHVLNEFKKVWTFTKESPMYSCGYHYMVNVCKGGQSIESFHINLNCNVIATNTGYFYFDSEKLSRFQSKLKKPFTKSEYFKDTIKAKSYLKKIASHKTLILGPSPAWANHEIKNKFETYWSMKPSVQQDPDNEAVVSNSTKSNNSKPFVWIGLAFVVLTTGLITYYRNNKTKSSSIRRDK